MSQRTVKNGQAGFSLVELMVVLTIIGLLAAAAIPNLRQRVQAGRVAAATQDLHCLATAMDNYALKNPSSPIPTHLNTYAEIATFSSANGCWLPGEDDPDFRRKIWYPRDPVMCYFPGGWIPCDLLNPQPQGGQPEVMAHEILIKVDKVDDDYPGRVLLLSSEKGIHAFTMQQAVHYQSTTYGNVQPFP